MKKSKLKFSEYKQNISRSKSFSKFVLIVLIKEQLSNEWIIKSNLSDNFYWPHANEFQNSIVRPKKYPKSISLCIQNIQSRRMLMMPSTTNGCQYKSIRNPGICTFYILHLAKVGS